METLDVPPSHPPPPPPKRLSRPKITLQIPEQASAMPQRGPPTAASMYWAQTRYQGRPPPGTPASHVSGPHMNPYFNPFLHMYQNKASDFMFKQFAGFKDFTMNTAKSGLSVGEKTAFWFFNKLSLWSKKWFTHIFLCLCLVLYSVMGAGIFMALEGPQEEVYDKNLTGVRRELASKIQDLLRRHDYLHQNTDQFLGGIEDYLQEYENNYTECMKHLHNNDLHKKTWTFWNSMFYAGTIYTTIDIVGMNKEGSESRILSPIKIPIIKAESETQTSGHLITLFPEKKTLEEMDPSQQPQNMSIRKRRNLSKNRGQGARQREKTPEPGRTLVPHEDTTTSDDDDIQPQRTSREIEADNTYEEMRRLVSQKAQVKDPVYDLDIDEVKEARAAAANERRRRSISPFALPDREELTKLERKGSFIDPGNKLLSTTYTLSPKEGDTSRRNSLTIEPPMERRSSLTPPTPSSVSPKEKIDFVYPAPSTPKKQDEILYHDDGPKTAAEDKTKTKPVTPIKKDKGDVFTFEKKEEKPIKQTVKPQTPKSLEPEAGELVTKVIQVERTPSKKLSQENRPNVEIRQRIVRTPSRKTTADAKPSVVKQPSKSTKEETQSKALVPPERPARSKSATRFGGKTSESEMSDQGKQQTACPVIAPRRKVVPTPRRFLRNRSPRGLRSQSVNRVDDLSDKSTTTMSQTSREIIELMEKNRARSLSIPKDDPKLPKEYKNSQHKSLRTPNKTPSTPRRSRGVSCPKTIQIISDTEILAGLSSKQRIDLEFEKRSRRSTGYIDASQSEYTSSCYSSTPSENDYDFDLSERTAELTRKLKLLSQQVQNNEANIILSRDNYINEVAEISKPVLRKRSLLDKNGVKKESKATKEGKKMSDKSKKTEKAINTKWRIFRFGDNWREFVEEKKFEYQSIKLLANRCICDLLLLIFMCGLGGMMFKTLEGSFENAYKCGTRNVKRDFIESLWRGSNYMREEEWKSMARQKLYEFEDQLHNAHEAGVTSYSGQRSWTFMNSFVYCLTLVTTIGYGHIAPKTTSGRVATIFYAIVGIPLFLIVLADFGKLFTRIIKFFWSFIRRFYYTRSCKKVRRTVHVEDVMKGLNIVYDAVRRPSQILFEDEVSQMKREEDTDGAPALQRKPSADIPPPLPPKPGPTIITDPEAETEPDTPAPSLYEIDDEFNLPISVAIFILICYIIIGAVGYNMWETWNFFESFYFVFISMSTIGLGDLVPDHPIFMMASILYLVFGLALTSMCINVVQVKLSDTFKQASAKLGATIGLKVAEEDGSLVPITPPPIEIAPVHKSRKTVEAADKDKDLEENEISTDSKNR